MSGKADGTARALYASDTESTAPVSLGNLDERGYVLVWALFAFIVLGGFAAHSLRMAGSQRQASKASAVWNQSFYAAEVGLQQAIGLATDSVLGGLAPGDSVDLGWRPIDTQTEYRAVIRRIDDGPHLLYQIRSSGREAGLFGGVTTVSQIVTTASDVADGFVFDRDLTVSGNAKVSGGCKIHANDWIYVSGSLTTDGPVSSNGPVEGNVITVSSTDATNTTTLSSGMLTDYAGATLASPGGTTSTSGSIEQYAEQEAPPEVYAEFKEACAAADYHVRDNRIMGANGDSLTIGGWGAQNWSVSNGEYFVGPVQIDSDVPGLGLEGSFCIDGSIKLDNNMGAAYAPQSVSLFATGYVEARGSQFLQPAPSSDILIAALGDILLEGTADPSVPNFRGRILGSSQCDIKGTARVDGSLECLGGLDPPGVKDLVNTNEITGDLDLVATCNTNSVVQPRPLTSRSWRHDN
ncbi:MAG: hypothetical protein OEU54_09300 [Gemmatimonadota bacterium]|nr:hypothetical protein [Gemmatimonadota bacterium]